MNSEKTFISYCWTTPEHEGWVLNFAEELVSAGVDVILDKWELKEGHDLIGFMEQMVTDSSVKKVIMICDRLYAEKADGRAGGVGTETQIISQKVYENQKQEKFVAVTVEKDENGKPYLPTYYKSRKYIDLSNDADYSKNYEVLLRWIYNRPLHVKPEIGTPPAFLTEDSNKRISTGVNYRRAVQAIKDHKTNAHIEIDIYYKNILEEIEKFRMNTGMATEEIEANIEGMFPLRNELSRMFDLISTYNPSSEIITSTTNFLEKLCVFFQPSKQQNSWSPSDFDNYKFIAHEIFLLLISSFIRNNRFTECKSILQRKFYIENNSYPAERLQSFGIFYNHLESIEIAGKQKSPRLISYHAGLLKSRSDSSNEKFHYIIQADLVCYLYYASAASLSNTPISYWYPITLIYHEGYGRALEVFERAADKAFFQDFSNLFPNKGMFFFDEIAHKIESHEIRQPRFDHMSVGILTLINYKKLNTL